MKLPILQSLTSPGHMRYNKIIYRNSWPPLNLETVKTLTFDMPDLYETFNIAKNFRASVWHIKLGNKEDYTLVL